MCLVAFVGIGLLLSVVSTHAEVGNVAFTAGFRAVQTIDSGKIVEFKEVITNLGNGYDSNTEVFTAPEKGLYLTSVSALTVSSEEFLVDLYHNNKYKISATAQMPGVYAYGANSVVLPLLKNDTVYVKTKRISYFNGQKDGVLTTFTGHLIGTSNASVKNVAFTAGFQEDQTIVGNQTVAYNKVFINSKRGYYNKTGVFTTPEDGIYVFLIRALAPGNEGFRLNLYKNDKYLISAYARHPDAASFGGNSIVLQLHKNDSVYVRASPYAYFYGRSNAIFATFTGFMIDRFSCKDGNVAFSAGFKNIDTLHGEIVVYKEVYTNVAGGYNSKTGVFTAPKGGVYVFNIHALAKKEREFWIDLYQNDISMISAFGRGVDEYAAGGNTIALQLKLGDKVYVRTQRVVYLYNRANEVYATFSGYLIETSC